MPFTFSSMQNRIKSLHGFFKKKKDMTMASLRQRLEKAEDCSPSPSSSSSEQFHVLAVDDSLVDRKVIERLLKVSAYKVTTVDSGKRALQLLGLDGDNSTVDFNALEVNMIITDYSMPEMTGYDLLKKIKESSTWKKIPVVIMSSENVLARIDRCLEEGAEEFITKPVKLSDVKRLRSYILRGGEDSGGSRKRKSPPSPLPSSREEIRRKITVD